MKIKACIFDLDGVIVDTAKYHFLAWKRLAEELGFEFKLEHNERLKGVSRVRSLEILLEVGGLSFSEKGKERMATLKNEWYLEYILRMKPDEILPGVLPFLSELRRAGVKIALGSASKNAPLILQQVEITNYFDVIIDGNKVSKAKPDPEVFLKAAEELGFNPGDCVVFEDAEAGVEAALRGNMRCVGVGSPLVLNRATVVIPGFESFNLAALEAVL
jgi:beta-phosphoglucomutase